MANKDPNDDPNATITEFRRRARTARILLGMSLETPSFDGDQHDIPDSNTHAEQTPPLNDQKRPKKYIPVTHIPIPGNSAVPEFLVEEVVVDPGHIQQNRLTSKIKNENLIYDSYGKLKQYQTPNVTDPDSNNNNIENGIPIERMVGKGYKMPYTTDVSVAYAKHYNPPVVLNDDKKPNQSSRNLIDQIRDVHTTSQNRLITRPSVSSTVELHQNASQHRQRMDFSIDDIPERMDTLDPPPYAQVVNDGNASDVRLINDFRPVRRPYTEMDQISHMADFDCRQIIDRGLMPGSDFINSVYTEDFTDIALILSTATEEQQAISQYLAYEPFDTDMEPTDDLRFPKFRRDFITTASEIFYKLEDRKMSTNAKLKFIEDHLFIDEDEDLYYYTYNTTQRRARNFDVANGFINTDGLFYPRIECSDININLREDIVIQIVAVIPTIRGLARYDHIVDLFDRFNMQGSESHLFKTLVDAIKADVELCMTYFPYEPYFHANTVGRDTTLASAFTPSGHETTVQLSSDEFKSIQERVLIERSKLVKAEKKASRMNGDDGMSLNPNTGVISSENNISRVSVMPI